MNNERAKGNQDPLESLLKFIAYEDRPEQREKNAFDTENIMSIFNMQVNTLCVYENNFTFTVIFFLG